MMFVVLTTVTRCTIQCKITAMMELILSVLQLVQLVIYNVCICEIHLTAWSSHSANSQTIAAVLAALQSLVDSGASSIIAC